MSTTTNPSPNALRRRRLLRTTWRSDAGHTLFPAAIPSRRRQRWIAQQKRMIFWGLFAFILLQLALGWGIENEISLRDPEYHQLERTLRERLAENPHKDLLLFVGSSRFTNGIDARRLNEHPDWGHYLVFNFGIPTAGPTLERIMIDRLLDRDIVPKIIYLEVLLTHLNAGPQQQLDQKMIDAARLSYSELRFACESGIAGDAQSSTDARSSHSSGNARGSLWGQWLSSRLLPMRRHQKELHDSIALDAPSSGAYSSEAFSSGASSSGAPSSGAKQTERADHHDDYGTRMRNVLIHTPEQMKALALRQYGRYLESFEVAQGPYRRLLQTIELCHQRGIEVVLLVMPEGQEFREGGGTEIIQKREAFIERIRREAKVPLIDARHWCANEDFYDGHHLSVQGATRFTARLSQETPSYQKAQKP